VHCVASLKLFRRRTLRFEREARFIDGWMVRVKQAAAIDVPLAVQVARLRGLVKGDGGTCERGLTKYTAIEPLIVARMAHANASLQLARLIAAAERDEGGAALGSVVEEMSGPSKLERDLVQAV
jgi:indolepyruvate ferredoxin oxidoreductase beta subunit